MDVTQVYLSRTNLLDILKDQGYNVSNYDHYSLSMIGSMMDNKRLDLQLTHASGKQVFIKYHFIHYNTHSSAKIFSDFLNLREREFQKNNTKMISIDYIVPLFKKNGVNLVFSTYGFQSKYMWTMATSLGLEKKY